MKKIIKPLFILAMAFALNACTFTNMFSHNGRLLNQSDSYFKHGKYFKSSIALIKILQDYPNHEKALELINTRLPFTINSYNKEIEELISKEKTSENLKSLAEKYENLTILHEEYYKILKITRDQINYKGSDLKSLKDKTAKAYYDTAISLKDDDQIETKKIVLELLEKVMKFNPNYKNLETFIKQVKSEAIEHVILEAVNENNSDIEVSNFIYYSILNSIKNDTKVMKYTDIIDKDTFQTKIKKLELSTKNKTREELGGLIGANTIIKLNISAIEYIKPDIKIDVNRDKKRNNLCEYRYEKYTSSTVILTYSIINLKTDQVLKRGEKSGRYDDSAVWYKYSSSSMGSNQIEKDVKSKLEMIRLAAEDAAEQTAYSIRKYLK